MIVVDEVSMATESSSSENKTTPPVIKKDLFFAGVGSFTVEEPSGSTRNAMATGSGVSHDLKMTTNSEAALRQATVVKTQCLTCFVFLCIILS